MGKKRVTIIEVAKAAGVSPTAVSFAFNNPERIGAETAERIRALATKMGYAPSPIARAMISSKTGAIGILVPSDLTATFANPFTSYFIEGVSAVCDEHSLSPLIVSPYESSLDEATRRALVDGYIVLGLDEKHAEIEPLRKRNVPFVIVDGDAESASEVNVDDEGGAYAAAAHLLAQGHRDIMIVTFEQPPSSHKGDVYYGVGGRRLRGYQRAFAESGASFSYDLLVQAATSVAGGAEAFKAAWSQGFHPSAVLAMSDAMAIGVCRAARDLGLWIPADLEVIGFDDLPLSSLLSPSLSTVHQSITEKGRLAAELLVRALEGEPSQEKVKLPTHLILRETTRSRLPAEGGATAQEYSAQP
jgi:DNA-binding LacI/PurR family transcriptional regulator